MWGQVRHPPLGEPVKRALEVMALVALIGVAWIPAPIRGDDKAVGDVPVKVISQPCLTDGYSFDEPCFWNARVRGNHQGDSFWVDVHGDVHMGLNDMPRPDYYVEGLDIMEGGS